MKEDYLQQNAFHDVDAYCSPEKQTQMLRNIFGTYDKMKELYQAGVELEDITSMDIFEKIARMKYDDNIENVKALEKEISNISADQFEIVTV